MRIRALAWTFGAMLGSAAKYCGFKTEKGLRDDILEKIEMMNVAWCPNEIAAHVGTGAQRLPGAADNQP